MNRLKVRSAIVSLSLLVVPTLLPGSSASEVPSAPIAEWDRAEAGECVYEESDFVWLRETLIPRVERLVGLGFASRPLVRHATPDEMVDALSYEFARFNMIEARDDRQREMIRAQALASARGVAPLLLGVFSRSESAVYLVTDRVAEVVESAGASRADCDEIVILVIAHELIHALQHQHVDLAKPRWKCVDYAARSRYHGRAEGHAFEIQEDLARELGIGERTLRASQRITVGALKHHDTAPQSVLDDLERQYEAYRASAAQLRRFLASEGPAAVWGKLAPPPCRGSE